MHPHVKISQEQFSKIEAAASKSSQENVQISKHLKKENSSGSEGGISKGTCKECGIKFSNLSRHMSEMHSTKRIMCPLKSCDFTAKRMHHIRTHWKKEHNHFEFPEIAQGSQFAYKTTKDDENVNISFFPFKYFRIELLIWIDIFNCYFSQF